MKSIKIIDTLINIEKKIRLCYKDIVDIELNNSLKNSSFKEPIEVYSEIRKYRDLEEFMLSKLNIFCTSVEEINKIYDYILGVYKVFNSSDVIMEYAKSFDKNIEARRLLSKIWDKYGEEFSDNQYDSYSDSNSVKIIDILSGDIQTIPSNGRSGNNKELLKSLMDMEDSVRLIKKIDTHLLLNCNDDSNKDNKKKKLTKAQLYQIKYDMFFLNDELEQTLVEEYRIPTLAYVDSKNIASIIYGLDDEEACKNYYEVREDSVFEMVDYLSQRKKQKSFNYLKQLDYIIIDMWLESLDDNEVSSIFYRLLDWISKSYNSEILDARHTVYKILLSKDNKEKIRNSQCREDVKKIILEKRN